jgi:hypothetical protein
LSVKPVRQASAAATTPVAAGVKHAFICPIIAQKNLNAILGLKTVFKATI